jgi:hypothetical protein
MRVLQGKPIYIAPNYEFIPMIYTPLYYYLSAFLKILTGLNIMSSMRLLSFFSSLVLFICIFILCQQRRLSIVSSVGAIGLFAATYSKTGFWFDVARVDTLFMALLSIAYVILESKIQIWNNKGILSGLFMVLAFFSKQQAIIPIVFLGVFFLIKRDLRSLLGLVSVSMVGALIYLVINNYTNGWLWFYTYTVPSEKPIYWTLLFSYFWEIYLKNYGYIISFSLVLGLIFFSKRHSNQKFPLMPILPIVLPLFIISIVTLSSQWGWINNLIPFSFLISLVVFINYEKLRDKIRSKNLEYRVLLILLILLPLLVIFQFIVYFYSPLSQVPTLQDKILGYKIIEKISISQSLVFIPTAPYFNDYAGKMTCFHIGSLGDIMVAFEKNVQVQEKLKPFLEVIENEIKSEDIQVAVLPARHHFNSIF